MNLKRPLKYPSKYVSAICYPVICALSVTIALGSCAQTQKLEAQEEQPSIQRAVTPLASNPDVEALVNIGPRITGTPAIKQARDYLVEEFRKAGYVTELQSFTYTKFVDLESTLTVGGTAIDGRALRGTATRQVSARLVVVPGVGSSTDFSKVDVKGAIAIVERGEIRFGQKVENAEKAGAIGLVIINNQPGSFSGSLTREATIPVLALSGEQGLLLLNQSTRQPMTGSLNVNAGQQEVTGQNVIARLAGVTQPKLIVGGHYDSVTDSPGANDNASGTAVTLAIARNLSRTPLARQTWFVAFDGEEDGLNGSRAFVKTAQPAFLKQLKGMLNFDMVGVNEQLQVSGTQSLTNLAQSQISKIKVSSESVNNSDHASFAAADVPVLFFHRGLDPNYHQPSDRTVNSKLLGETTDMALTIIKQILN